MKLNEAINWSIYTYPILFRHRTWEESAILVLNHIFISYGTGLEWHPDGFLCRHNGRSYDMTEHRKTLPKGFFEKKLMTMEIDEAKKKEAHEYLRKRNVFHYFISGKRFRRLDCVFESQGRDLDDKFHSKFMTHGRSGSFLHEAVCAYREESFFQKRFGERYKHFHPGGLCEYSAIVELTEGRTNSPHIKNFRLTNVSAEWIEGAIKIAREALKYYNDPERYKYDHCFPTEMRIRQYQEELDEAIKTGKEKEYRRNYGFQKSISVEERLKRSWEIHKKMQISLLTAFLLKFDPDFAHVGAVK